eukprot:3939725-Rhodomonas_salina.1
MMLRLCYAMSGNDLMLRLCYAMSGTDLGYGLDRTQQSHHIASTEIGNTATRRGRRGRNSARPQRYRLAKSNAIIRILAAMCTSVFNLVLGHLRCAVWPFPVLSEAMLLPGFQTPSGKLPLFGRDR